MNPSDAPFTLDDWLVQPRLNRLTRGGREHVQVEPKMMDVLVFLAQRAGDVVSREELIDGVWPDLFVTESVLTRAIAGLRRAFGDDARSPAFIETIAKRGYRLLPRPVPRGGRPAAAPAPTTARGQYVVGQWVRGERFYGRGSQLAEVLEGPRNGVWVAGTRRSGKTSFLKQLEHLAATEPGRGLVPVFWDLEGAEDADGLALDLESALADAASQLEAAGVTLAEVVDRDLYRMLAGLRRQLAASGRLLFLLCDEAEELLTVAAHSSGEVRRLRRALLAHDGMRTVIASGPRLWDLAVGADTSPFLDGFLPPLYIGPLDRGAARELVLQTQLDVALRPSLPEEAVEVICARAGNHPYLLQLLCRRAVEGGGVAAAVAAVAAERSVTTLFEVDLALFDETQQRLLRRLARHETAAGVGDDPQALLELHQLGLVADDDDGNPQVTNPLFREWLATRER